MESNKLFDVIKAVETYWPALLIYAFFRIIATRIITVHWFIDLFLLSFSFGCIFYGQKVWTMIHNRYVSKRQRTKMKDVLSGLSHEEKQFIAEFLVQNSIIIQAYLSPQLEALLIGKRLITQKAFLGYCSYGKNFHYELNPLAWKLLNDNATLKDQFISTHNHMAE